MKDIKWEVVPYTRGVGLDLSEGMSLPLFPRWISLANTPGLNWRALPQFADKSLDFVFSAATLGFVADEDRPKVLKEWWRVVKYGGALALAIDQKHMREEELADMMHQLGGWDLAVRKEYQEDGAFLHIYVKGMDRNKRTHSHAAPRPAKTVCVIRYGAIGDCVVASSILPALKDQGYHVVFNTQERGFEILKHDPHIDEFVLQDKDQVDSSELSEWWVFLKRKYGKVINLSETMEGTICTVPGRADFTWPHSVRRKYRAHNYYEFAHDVAEVPLPPRAKFYATEAEKKWAERQRKELGRDTFVVMWVMSGSAVNKRIPQQDFVLGIPGAPGVLEQFPNMRVILVGDDLCKTLQSPWRGHPQVLGTAGKWSVRQTLAMLDQVDLVVGPETGITNASGIQRIPTIVFLSHTSEDTLCRYWGPHTALYAECECFPCYRLHYTRDTCDVDDEVPASKCIRDVPVEEIQAAIAGYVSARKAA